MSFSKDKGLLKKIQSGEQEALEVLFKKYFQSLCEFASSYVNQREVAEEIVSDVFFSIWIKRNEITIKLSLKSYLFAAVKNKSLDQLKKQQQVYSDLTTLDNEGHADSPSVLSEIDYRDLEKEVNDMIEELPPQRQKVFKLNRFEGLKYKEIADILKISVNTVQKQMTLAIQHIAQHRYKFEKLYPDIIDKDAQVKKRKVS